MRAIHFQAIGIGFTLHSTRLNDYVLLIINDSIQFLGWHTQQVTNLIWKRTEVPDMSYRNNKFDMTSTLTTNFLLCYLNTTTITNDSLITDALVLSAGALVVLGRTENALAEQTITFRLVCTIIDGFRLCNLTIRIFQDLLRRGKTDGNLRKIILYLCIFFESHVSLSKLGVLKINQV